MISSQNSECFVYIALPGETELITAGKFVTSVIRSGLQGNFVYGKSYLARRNAVEIDNTELKLKAGTFTTTRLGGIFGALRDASPDFWGRRLIEKLAGRTELSEIDYLLLSPDDRAGALSFGTNRKPSRPRQDFNQSIQLPELQRIAQSLIDEEMEVSASPVVQIKELFQIGTSLGGGRPKAVIEDDTGLWVAKFNRYDDRWNNARVEHAMLELARQCGINAARSKVERIAGKDILLVRRFDREKTSLGYLRARMVSGLTVLKAEDSAHHRDRWSYVLLVEEMRRYVSQPTIDSKELFRRMCFNALISNLDDHPRNHALLAMNREWSLSPAFDLTPSPVVSLERRDLAMTCGNVGRFAHKQNLLSQASRFLLDQEEASRIVSEMGAQIASTWRSVASAQGVTERDIETIKSAFVYPGFEL
jgi:serine/threonine-protein kinase HipA